MCEVNHENSGLVWYPVCFYRKKTTLCASLQHRNLRLVSWFTRCMWSGGTDGMSCHHTQLNTIVYCSQATLHSLIMSFGYCWRPVARLQELKRSSKNSEFIITGPFFSLTSLNCVTPGIIGRREEGICMVQCFTYSGSSILCGRHQLSLVLCHIGLYAPTHPAVLLHNHTLL